ncbi:hypothetical protein [Mycolicibacterium fortuitum]|uniref:hypothetical protein n=1 Tax=Mycolicibacterium fortuitum TaxID=1766 RepID=UPI00260FC385|nr:hypothetical protein [Mycolicibacterium fortuitum]
MSSQANNNYVLVGTFEVPQDGGTGHDRVRVGILAHRAQIVVSVNGRYADLPALPAQYAELLGRLLVRAAEIAPAVFGAHEKYQAALTDAAKVLESAVAEAVAP